MTKTLTTRTLLAELKSTDQLKEFGMLLLHTPGVFVLECGFVKGQGDQDLLLYKLQGVPSALDDLLSGLSERCWHLLPEDYPYITP